MVHSNFRQVAGILRNSAEFQEFSEFLEFRKIPEMKYFSSGYYRAVHVIFCRDRARVTKKVTNGFPFKIWTLGKILKFRIPEIPV